MSIKLMACLVFLLLAFTYAVDLTGKQAPEFNGTDINGNEINLSDYRGKIVLLDFWASWCGPCQEEFPFLIDFYRKFKKDSLIVLAVNIDNKKENVLRFLNKYRAKNMFPVIFDPEKIIPPLYELNGMPTSVFIDKEGIIRFTHTGFNNSSKKQFTEELTTLLSKN